ncbi:MAG: response regulator, partial [Pseudomonadota bacterium]
VMQVIDSASALIRRTFSMKIELDVEAGEGGDWAADAAIEVDPRMLECALINLAINARDTMPSGGRLTIGLSHQPSDGPNAAGTVHITVRDTGEGLAPEIVQRAINPKLAGEEELQSQTLGLAAVAGFLAQADGKMSIDSAPGQGTTVRMSFPEARARPAALSAPEPATGRFAGHRVLVVEDEPNVRRALTLQLKALGFEAQSVGHADAALGICRSGNPPDLVVSDIDMPGRVNGLELSSIFADEFPDLPVLLVSGHVDGRAASDVSGRGFLPKPFSSAQLTEAVARLMEQDADAPTQSNVVRLFDERA